MVLLQWRILNQFVYDRFVRKANDFKVQDKKPTGLQRYPNANENHGTAIENYYYKPPLISYVMTIPDEPEEFSYIYDNFEEMLNFVIEQLGHYFPTYQKLDLKGIKNIPWEHF